ncbi:unnamed protein product [Prorocentrum cordatum]|uniref:Uncharacterized protein n=1 Tax=Prorocentrum cordatum TaxID=2364126 RepID=A0ABN9U7E8_9DINO|nr:unnamed protein product [Polarella glacialis]
MFPRSPSWMRLLAGDYRDYSLREAKSTKRKTGEASTMSAPRRGCSPKNGSLQATAPVFKAQSSLRSESLVCAPPRPFSQKRVPPSFGDSKKRAHVRHWAWREPIPA